MRLRGLALTGGLAALALGGAARAGPRPAAAVLAAEGLASGAFLVAGARRFRAPTVVVRDGSAVAYHIDAAELFGLGAGFAGPGRRIVDGVPLVDYGSQGEQLNPAYLGWWSLAHATRYADAGDPADRETSLRAARALVDLAAWRGGAAVWPYRFTWPVFDWVLRPPWISAMAQGLAISALVRAHRLTDEGAYLDTARAAALPFARSVADGGVRASFAGRPLYEEYPGTASRVLDGSLFGLLGLYDLTQATDDATVRRLLRDGVAGIVAGRRAWDALGVWSRYGRSGYLATPEYHALNTALMRALGRLTGRAELCELAGRWQRAIHPGPWRVAAFALYWAAAYAAGLRGRLAGPARPVDPVFEAAACVE